MWMLVSLENPDLKYYILCGKEYVVGRKDCPVLVTGDAAVSRKHAVIEATHNEINLNKPANIPILKLKDLSKYGTWVNKKKMETSSEVEVQDGTNIMFGSPKSEFIAVYEPLVVTTSCLLPTSKKQVRQCMKQLGGHIVNEWTRDCCYLIMNTISVTIKVVSALVSLKPIVSPEYLEECINSIEGGGKIPDSENFIPTVSESQVDCNVVSFANNPERRKVFQGITFVFLQNKQFQKMSLAIESGGGTPLLMDESPKHGEEKTLVQPGYVVMNCGLDESASETWKDWYFQVTKLLKRHKKFMIQDAEIGFAVLYCSTENHCNPDKDFASQYMNSMPSQSISQAAVVMETQDTEPAVQNKRSIKIEPETPSKEPETPSSSKRFENKDIHVPKANETSQKRLTTKTKDVPSSNASLSPSSRFVPDSLADTSMDQVVDECSKLVKKEKVYVDNTVDHSPLRRGSEVIKESASPEIPFKEEKKRKSYSPQKTVEMSDQIISQSTNRKIQKAVASPNKTESSLMSASNGAAMDISKTNTGSVKGFEGNAKRKKIIIDDDSDEDYGFSRNRGKRKRDSESDEDVNPFAKSVRRRKPDPVQAVCAIDSESKSESSVNVVPISKTIKRERPDNSPSPGRVEDSANSMISRGMSVMKECKPVSTQSISSKSVQSSPLEGFISARTDRQIGRVPTSVYVKEEGEPVGQVVVKFADLVFHRERPLVDVSEDNIHNGYCRWQGKIVPNFKKFVKKGQAIRIINSENREITLLTHEASQKKEVEEMFKDYLEAESQETEAERRADELFGWAPDNTATRKSRR